MNIGKLLAPLRRRLKCLIGRAVGLLVDPAALLQALQVELLADEVLDKVEHVEGYGRTAHPPAGFEVITASLGGDRSHTVALTAFHRQFRLLGLAEGEVALYDDLGNVVHLMRDKIKVNGVALVEVAAPAVTVNAESTHNGNITINGNVTVTGAIAAGGQISSAVGVKIGALELGTHKHGGVQTGAGVTGGPQ